MSGEAKPNGRGTLQVSISYTRIVEWILLACATAIMGLGTNEFRTIVSRLDRVESLMEQDDNRDNDSARRITILEQTYVPAKELYAVFADIRTAQQTLTANQGHLLKGLTEARADIATLNQNVTRHIAIDEKQP